MIHLSAKTNEHAGFFVDTACTIHNLSFVRNSPVFSQTRMVLADVQARGHGTFASMDTPSNTPITVPMFYTCRVCGAEKPKSDFYQIPKTGNPRCKKCCIAVSKQSRNARRWSEIVGFIYFLQAEDGNRLIKIGFAENVRKRVQTMRGQSPSALTILGSFQGNMKEEKELHSRFAHCRSHGEWFYPVPSLMTFIAETLASEQTNEKI